jgi:hypothetical protein
MYKQSLELISACLCTIADHTAGPSLCRCIGDSRQNFLFGGQPVLLCLTLGRAAGYPYFVRPLANPIR